MRIILCEGAADEAFFRKLIEKRKLPEFRVRYPGDTRQGETGGRKGFATKLRQLRIEREFDSVSAILIVSDNDEDGALAFGEVQRQIKAAEFEAPTAPLVSTSSIPAISIMMIPW